MKILKATCSCGKIYDYDPKRPDICPACIGSLKGDKGQDERAKHWTAMHVRGWRPIDGRVIYFPNKMEANYYRLCVFLKANEEILNFDYQPPEFDFRPFGITKGIVTYRVDFRIITHHEDYRSGHLQAIGGPYPGDDTTPPGLYFVELKGYIGPDHKTKTNRMKKFYPEIKIKTIDYKTYKELAAQVGKIIPGWEF